jgi:puromycin-sensitive aminopeptidase
LKYFGGRYYNINIAGIIDDSHALSMARQQTLTSLLRLLYCYRGEADYSVLSHINSVCKSCSLVDSIMFNFFGDISPISFSLVWQVTASISKISVDATPGLAGDIKQLLIKILLSPAEYAQPCHI